MGCFGVGFSGGGGCLRFQFEKIVTAWGKIGCMVNYENINFAPKAYVQNHTWNVTVSIKFAILSFTTYKGGTAGGGEIILSC